MKLNQTGDALHACFTMPPVQITIGSLIGSLHALFLPDTMTSEQKYGFNEKISSPFRSFISRPRVPRTRKISPKKRERANVTIIVMEELECRLFVIPKLFHPSGRRNTDYFIFLLSSRRSRVESSSS